MNTFVRIALLLTGLLLGVHAVTFAQKPDSIFTVIHEGSTLLRLNTDAGFVVRGTPEVGEIPAEGTGVRMMWFPARWAFRAGKVDSFGSTYWDLKDIGTGSVAMGTNTRARGANSVALGWATTASGAASVALGDNGTASGDMAFAFNGTASSLRAVAIGFRAQATEEDALALGTSSTSSGVASVAIGPTIADGAFAVGIGLQSSATGDFSVAIGKDARTNKKSGSIVLGDGCAFFSEDSVYATAKNQIVARGCGGIKLYTDKELTAGVELAPGGSSWLQVSDVNRKENFETLDGEEVLLRLREVPVMTWNYKSQDAEIRHAGPTAQDFHAAFGLGESELMINTIDIDGINLAAIKALEERTRELREATAEIEVLQAEVATLDSEVATQRQRVATLEAEAAAQNERIATLERQQREILERLGQSERREQNRQGEDRR